MDNEKDTGESIGGNYKRSVKNESDVELLEKVNIETKNDIKNLVDEMTRLHKNLEALARAGWVVGAALIVTLIAEIVKGFII